MSGVGSNRQLNDLVFELSQDRESKFLLIVCDDAADQRRLGETLQAELEKLGKKIGIVFATSVQGDLLSQFFEASKVGTVDALILRGLTRLAPAVLDSLFADLNFHRDALAGLKIPILIWLTNTNLQRLASIAPDFWSRRTAVYRFTPQSTKELLRKLFASDADGTSTKVSPAAQSIRQVIECEKSLAKCLRTGSYSVEHADNAIRIIESEAKNLLSECARGRQIDIALLLWSVAHLDRDLHDTMEHSPAQDRNIYEYLYTDRNEALLHTAQEMPKLLTRYLKEIPEDLRRKRRPNLVNRFRKIALFRLREIATDVASYVGVTLETLEKWAIESEEGTDSDEPSATLDNTFGARASYDLESWLSGYNDERPAVFSEREGRLLKLLYSSESSLAEIGAALEMTQAQTRAEVGRLREKVELFLTTSESVRNNPSIRVN